MSLQESIQKLNDLDLSDLDINDIDFNNMGMWPLAGKVVVWVIVFVGVLIATYQVDIKNILLTHNKEVAKEQTLREEFEKKVNDAANLEAYRNQMVEMEASFEALLKQLPQDTEVPALLDDITQKGQDSGLTFNSVDLKKEKKEEYYVELPIDINVEGGYHDFGSFVSGIAALPRIVTLDSFTIAASGAKSLSSSKKGGGKKGAKGPAVDDDESSRKGVLGMVITAKTFRYKSQSELSDAEEETSGPGAKKKKKRKTADVPEWAKNKGGK